MNDEREMGEYIMMSHMHRTGRRRVAYAAGAVVVLCLLSLIFFPRLRHPIRLFSPGTRNPPRPDLTDCTRLEIQYHPSIWQSLFWNETGRSLLNAEEEQYLRSLKSIVVVDPNDIATLADEVAWAEDEGLSPEPFQAVNYVTVTAHFPSKPEISFSIWGPWLEVPCGRAFYRFHSSHNLELCLADLRPQVRPFEYRVYCAQTLQALHSWIRTLTTYKGTYPQPAEWCDAVERIMRARGFQTNQVKWTFICPSLRKGRCDYAMNLDCRADAPADMVLLFETKPGWNQHGGPELFTFDSHDPKGGLALLNNGTVKFIRTEEDLKQLRWK